MRALNHTADVVTEHLAQRLVELGDRRAAASARAHQATQAVLGKVFRGEVVPTEAEVARQEGREYEPASVLLERIRREREGGRTGAANRPGRVRRANAPIARAEPVGKLV